MKLPEWTPDINPQIDSLEENDQEAINVAMMLFSQELTDISYDLSSYLYKKMSLMDQLKCAKGRFTQELEKAEKSIWKVLHKRAKL